MLGSAQLMNFPPKILRSKWQKSFSHRKLNLQNNIRLCIYEKQSVNESAMKLSIQPIRYYLSQYIENKFLQGCERAKKAGNKLCIVEVKSLRKTLLATTLPKVNK